MKPLTYGLGTGLLIFAMSNGYAQSIVHPNWSPVPPLEYDYPYEGHLRIWRNSAEFPDMELCPKPEKGRFILGCAIRYRELDGTLSKRKCDIYIAPESLISKYGLSFEDALRHEMAHCNGWSTNHEGSRPLGAPRGKPRGEMSGVNIGNGKKAVASLKECDMYWTNVRIAEKLGERVEHPQKRESTPEPPEISISAFRNFPESM
jgi:hypothetical protein